MQTDRKSFAYLISKRIILETDLSSKKILDDSSN